MDMEAMLKKELSGISSEEKSKRIRLCKHDTACCMSPFPLSFLPYISRPFLLLLFLWEGSAA
jgi:hypothetical protein